MLARERCAALRRDCCFSESVSTQRLSSNASMTLWTSAETGVYSHADHCLHIVMRASRHAKAGCVEKLLGVVVQEASQ
jgi:hypothetical protein